MIAPSGVAQVVAQHRHEHLVQAERLGPLLQLLHELLLLPVQLEEHVGLVREDARLDRLVEKVDGARCRSP